MEVWKDTDEEWKACTIDSVYEFAVPNTDLAIRQYTVMLGWVVGTEKK